MIESQGDRAKKMTRRTFVAAGACAAVGLIFMVKGKSEIVKDKSEVANGKSELGEATEAASKEVTVVEFSDSGQRGKTVTLPMIVKAEAEWKKQLSPAAFDVTRHADTELAYTGKYWNLHDKGIYRCICCDTALFSSETKFESGTGWPSFWQPIAKENVREISDSSLGMVRIAVSCRRCDAHLGHVFDDGPQPTGLRYCMNSVSLRFVKLA
ncbi:MAG TPA: peptide-methionine (R)-S-oxide reductase MsrB [Candidatus Angelobacter sp.]|nr:peptide-methionine (R)-S-oxide reductase MsrB [Candidatus Angelobacter sp.]